METTRDILIFSVGVMGGIGLGAGLFIAFVEYIKYRLNKLK